jgi:hypothetical protein
MSNSVFQHLGCEHKGLDESRQIFCQGGTICPTNVLKQPHERPSPSLHNYLWHLYYGFLYLHIHAQHNRTCSEGVDSEQKGLYREVDRELFIALWQQNFNRSGHLGHPQALKNIDTSPKPPSTNALHKTPGQQARSTSLLIRSHDHKALHRKTGGHPLEQHRSCTLQVPVSSTHFSTYLCELLNEVPTAIEDQHVKLNFTLLHF